MTESEMECLRKLVVPEKVPLIGACPGPDRTLLYGYDVDRRTWHVYQNAGRIRRLIYQGEHTPFIDNIVDEKLDARLLVPNKRLYPDACDFAFCKKLKHLDVYLPFTNINSLGLRPPGATYLGRTY